MNVWARRTFVVLGLLVLIFGGLLQGPMLFIAAVAAGVMFVLAARRPAEGPTSAGLVVIRGETWTRDSAGRPNRWHADTQTWEVVDPPPPDVIRAWGRHPSTPDESSPGRLLPVTGLLLAILLGLAGWAFVDPYANIPFVSEVVCSLKGASWQEGSTVLEVPPGCYTR